MRQNGTGLWRRRVTKWGGDFGLVVVTGEILVEIHAGVQDIDDFKRVGSVSKKDDMRVTRNAPKICTQFRPWPPKRPWHRRKGFEHCFDFDLVILAYGETAALTSDMGQDIVQVSLRAPQID